MMKMYHSEIHVSTIDTPGGKPTSAAVAANVVLAMQFSYDEPPGALSYNPNSVCQAAFDCTRLCFS
ncbi:hypothetical protein [uncultured Tateyamaria sp.]|uniref:hypothetical protein n=1 Tax=uncultured Tateyamaria sp. TaxID=455651 RepID=UPI002608CB09|nr:hypothetical protein [uncultured Tateyamaria sp.]